MNLNNKKIWFLGYALCCLSPYIYDQFNQNGDSDTLVIVNKFGTLANLSIVQTFDCPGKGKVTGIKKDTKLFDGIQETIPFAIPVDKKNCSATYHLHVHIERSPDIIDKDYVLTDINKYQYQIYDPRQGAELLQAVPWQEVRPGVIVQDSQS